MKALYGLSLLILRGCAKLYYPVPVRIWARNSWRLDYFQNWVSDLDLSFYFPEGLPTAAIPRHRNFLRLASRIFPMLCEVNSYSNTDSHFLAPIINPFELGRDPDLGTQIKEARIPNSESSNIEAAIFLCRMAFSDSRNLFFRPRLRRKKWAFHFQQLDREFDPEKNILEQILQTLADLLELPADQKDLMKKQVKAYLHFIAQGEHSIAYKEIMRKQVWVWSLFGHRFPFDHSVLPVLTEQQKSLIAADLRWEIFGAITQARQSPDGTFQIQIEDCKKLVSALDAGSEADLWKALHIQFDQALHHINTAGLPA